MKYCPIPLFVSVSLNCSITVEGISHATARETRILVGGGQNWRNNEMRRGKQSGTLWCSLHINPTVNAWATHTPLIGRFFTPIIVQHSNLIYSTIYILSTSVFHSCLKRYDLMNTKKIKHLADTWSHPEAVIWHNPYRNLCKRLGNPLLADDCISNVWDILPLPIVFWFSGVSFCPWRVRQTRTVNLVHAACIGV